jgi:acetylornithine/succinyldiaminopimelate/putrescine aminotransferase
LPYNDLTGLEKLDDDTKAVFVECVQGEGGVIPGERKFLEALGACCIEKEILLVVDEVQTGVGRTGKMLSFQHHNLNPDVVTMAKGLGGGMPIGAILANENVASILQFGDHGSTFGGNPLACASALASIQAVLDEKLSENARKNRGLTAQSDYSIVGIVSICGFCAWTWFNDRHRICRSLPGCCTETTAKGLVGQLHCPKCDPTWCHHSLFQDGR